MAYASSTRFGTNGIADRVAEVARSVKTAVQRRGVYVQTLRELNALTDRELSDLDINRSMIRRIALDAAYGK
ncbi:MAG: DUF1127 domain-containing protein [Paracoccaceae bacterium]